MSVVRYLVDDVDAGLAFYRALGFRLADRWGPPFAIELFEAEARAAGA